MLCKFFLIVEDDKRTILELESILENLGYHNWCNFHFSGEETIQHVGHLNPDLILTNI